MIGYKLTDQNLQTFNSTQWQIGEWKETSGNGNLCGPGWLHYYSDPLLAVLLNPIHANFQNPRLFEAEVADSIEEELKLKFGCTKMRLVKELQLPVITAEQRVKFAIYCALEIDEDPAFVTWANNWLDGADRTAETAKKGASVSMYWAARIAAYWAAEANANGLASCTYPASWIGNVAYWAADCAYWAAKDAKFNCNKFDLIALAKKAME